MTTKKNVFRRMFDSALSASDSFKKIRSDILDLATNVNTLAKSVVGVAQAVQSHHNAITELYAIHAEMIKSMKSSSTDASLRDIKKKDGHDKPN